MFKKITFYLLLFLGTIPILVNASDNSAVKVGNSYYDTLAEAIANASSTDTIMLISDIDLEDSLLINKVINIDLNGHELTAPTMVFKVQGGTLNINGEGTIKETEPNYGAVMLIGSSEETDSEYSVVNVGSNVTLEGWSGIFITHENSASYGVIANLAGKINAINDIDGGSGAGIYVNGKIQDQTNAPIINILDGAEITSTGNGLYIAGFSTFNIYKAYISGNESGIGIKSGTLNIFGATVECLGEDNTPTEGYNNGIKASGTTIQIESNSNYAGDIKLNIKSGNFTSQASNVIYEYIGKGTTSQVTTINIAGGTFKSNAANKDVFSLSNSFKEQHPSFIIGGTYSSDPSPYLQTNYTTTLDNNLYTVIKTTMKEIDTDTTSATTNSNHFLKWLIILIIVFILITISYFKRKKILNFLSNLKK